MLLKFWPKKTGVGFMRYRLPTAIMSSILIALAIFLVVTRGLNFGIDFIGGSVVEIERPPARLEQQMQRHRGRVPECDEGLGRNRKSADDVGRPQREGARR